MGRGKRGLDTALHFYEKQGVGDCGADGDARDRCTLAEAHRRAHVAQTEDRQGVGMHNSVFFFLFGFYLVTYGMEYHRVLFGPRRAGETDPHIAE